MTIEHHPEEATLAAYAAGALDLGQHVALATHLRACPHCRDWVRAMERLGGALVADSPEAELSAGALAKALARLDEPPGRPRRKRPRRQTRRRSCRRSCAAMRSDPGGSSRRA